MDHFIAKTFLGLESVLAQELKQLGAEAIKPQIRAISFQGDLRLMYKANFWLRTASRILKIIKTFNAKTADEIYNFTKEINWDEYLDVNQTFAIDATINSETFYHSQFAAYRVKDAIADYFNEKYGRRPSVRITDPDIFINLHISANQCTISLDSSGESLHKRGYRNKQTKAPINEALAAGMLLLAGYDGKISFIDPMCGSGTFLIEAALIALNIPPGIFRKKFAFENWKDFDKELFDEIYNDDSIENDFNGKIYGYDISTKAIETTLNNVKSAGLNRYIDVKKCSIADFKPETHKALIITNPPYGERLWDNNISALYNQIGQTLKHQCNGMTAWIISSSIDYLKKIGLKPSKKIDLLNGDLKCQFWKFDIFSGKRNEFLSAKNKHKTPIINI